VLLYVLEARQVCTPLFTKTFFLCSSLSDFSVCLCFLRRNVNVVLTNNPLFSTSVIIWICSLPQATKYTVVLQATFLLNFLCRAKIFVNFHHAVTTVTLFICVLPIIILRKSACFSEINFHLYFKNRNFCFALNYVFS